VPGGTPIRSVSPARGERRRAGRGAGRLVVTWRGAGSPGEAPGHLARRRVTRSGEAPGH
jgi:hypothetical protein